MLIVYGRVSTIFCSYRLGSLKIRKAVSMVHVQPPTTTSGYCLAFVAHILTALFPSIFSLFLLSNA